MNNNNQSMPIPEFQFIECSIENAFEQSQDNSRYINKIGDGIIIPENSKISLESAYVNSLGSDESVIEIKKDVLKPSFTYQFTGSKTGIFPPPTVADLPSGEYTKVITDNHSNKVTMTLQYYKSMNGNYCYPASYPFAKFGNPDAPPYRKEYYFLQGVPRGMMKVYMDTLGKPSILFEEPAMGINQSVGQSSFGYNFPIDNKKYTMCKKTNATSMNTQLGTDTGWKRTADQTFGFSRSTSLYHYNVYNKQIDIEITEGSNTPESIAEQMTQQLNKASEPSVVPLDCYLDEPGYAKGNAEAWTDYETVNGTIQVTTPCLEKFNCGNRRTYSRRGYSQFYAVKFTDGFIDPTDAVITPIPPNNDIDVIFYDSVYNEIGIYNPELFIQGRQLELDPLFHSGIKNYWVTTSVANAANDLDIFTNIVYSEEILKPFSLLFNYQTKDDAFYDNFRAKDAGATKENSVFLHMEFNDMYLIEEITLDQIQKTEFGTSQIFQQTLTNTPVTTLGNEKMTNCLYIQYQKELKDVFSNTNAYGVFTPYRNTQDKKLYCKFTCNIPNVSPSGAKFFEFPLSSNFTYKTAGSLELAAFSYIRRIGWDCNFTANGNQSIVLYNGLDGESAVKYNVPESFTTTKTLPKAPGASVADVIPDLVYKNFSTKPLFTNSFISRAFQRYGTIYYYDTAINFIYLGSSNASIIYNNDENRYTLQDFHTPLFENNDPLSAYSSLITTLATGADGQPQIFLGKDIADSSVTDAEQTKIPLTANQNAGTPIYKISPTSISLSQTEIYGINVWQDTFSAYDEVTSANVQMYTPKSNTIFDSECGIFIASFGVNDDNFELSLWDIMGFSKEQCKNTLEQPFTNLATNTVFIDLDRNIRHLNQGVNLNDKFIFPFTTNADILTNEIITWKTNPYGLAYQNTLGPPSNVSVLNGVVTTVGEAGTVAYDYTEMVEYHVTQNQNSTKLFAQRLIKKTTTPFFQIRSNILQNQYIYHGGSKNQSSRLPCVGLVNRAQPGADYFSDISGGVTYIIKKRLVINNIITEIFDNLGKPASNISPYSSVVYRIESIYTSVEVTPYQTLGEYKMAEEVANKKTIKKNKK